MPWMIRLGQAGARVTWVWTLVTFALLAVGVGSIWLVPVRRSGWRSPVKI